MDRPDAAIWQLDSRSGRDLCVLTGVQAASLKVYIAKLEQRVTARRWADEGETNVKLTGTRYADGGVSMTCSRCSRTDIAVLPQTTLVEKLHYFLDMGWQRIDGCYVCKDCA